MIIRVTGAEAKRIEKALRQLPKVGRKDFDGRQKCPPTNLLAWPYPLSPNSVIFSGTMPGEPVGKERPRFVLNGGRPQVYTDHKTKRYEESLRTLFLLQLGRIEPIAKVELGLRCVFFRSLSQRADTDNFVKCVLDAGNRFIYQDDSQVVEVYAKKVRVDVEPRAEILIHRVEP